MDRKRRFSAFVARDRDPRSTIIEALQFVRDFLPGSSLDERARIKAVIIVEELVSNVLRHGGNGRDVSLTMVLDDVEDGVALDLEDDGAPFDPTSATEFDGPDPRTGGGIGLAIVRTWGEDISYTRAGERNVLRLTIR